MNRNDIIDILTAVQAVDHRSIGETDITVWGAIIGKLPNALALQAVIDHRRECPGVWLEPGHIHGRVRAIQRDRRERMTLDELRAEQDRYDARLAPKLLELAEAKTIPDDDVPLRYTRPSADPATAQPLSVPCTWCKAAVAQRCTNTATKRPLRSGVHDARMRAVHGMPPAAPPRLPTVLVTADHRCANCADELHDEPAISRGLCDQCAGAVDGPQQPANGKDQTA